LPPPPTRSRINGKVSNAPEEVAAVEVQAMVATGVCLFCYCSNIMIRGGLAAFCGN
jgi:hypothetical protein